MDATLLPLMDIPVAVPLGPPRVKWTRERCEALEATGFFAGGHAELIDGDLIDKMGKNQPHVLAVAFLREWLRKVFGHRFLLLESPIDVHPADNEFNTPEPDLVILNRPFTEFSSSRPGPGDVGLLIEVSDSTLYFDLKTKAGLYARAGIADYWVLDVTGRRVIVHRHPANGAYTAIHVYGEQEAVSPLASPQAEFRAAYAFAEFE